MSIALDSLDANGVTETGDQENSIVHSLPPADKGSGAWKFLFGCFIIEAILWGFPLTFGVFQDYYSSNGEFGGDTVIIGVLSTSAYFLSAPLATPLARRFQRWQRSIIITGSLICPAALIMASFVTSTTGLILTQGALYGIGFALLYSSLIRLLDEWFIQRRGLAYGVVFAGSAFSGIGFPFLVNVLLERYGHRTTLRAIAIAELVLVVPVFPLLKGRLPVGDTAFRRIDTSFLSQPLFYCFSASNFMQGLGLYIPSLYLPTFASSLGLSNATGSLVLALYNIAVALSQLVFGFLSDRVSNVLILVFVSSMTSAIAAVLWGFAKSTASLAAFALIYGGAAGGFVSLWQKFASTLSDDPQPAYSMMAFGKGIGTVAIGPISSKLIFGPVFDHFGLGRYQALILFLSGTMFCSSLGILGLPLRVRRPE